MRFLELDYYPSFSLTEFAEDELPQYAVLSHTWGRDGDEVTYKDILDDTGDRTGDRTGNRTGDRKPGYDKLHFCAVQAKSDGLRYCWIDTCCIDKTNAAELTESINSMFRWYQNAVKCYVFLKDVSVLVDESDRDSQMQKSRWFTRGWTLQELIAPRCVEFFSQEQQRFGDKKSLEQQIKQITGISIYALRGEPLSRFSVAERLSWKEGRSTKRGEDMAYSLLGIFDINMPAIYGEGERNAFRRLLKEIDNYSVNHLLDKSFERLSLFPTEPQKRLQIQPKWIVPFERNLRFTGRELELAQLEEKLFTEGSTTKVAITGLGGVGKTQLVLESLFRMKDKHNDCTAVWISAVNMESLQQSYLDVAQQLGILGCEEDKADVKRLVQSHLSKQSTGRWLLVFDNADDIDMWIAKAGSKQQGSPPLIDYLPKSKQGAVVFTIRDRKIAVKLAQPNVVDVPAMGEDTATELLGRCLVNRDLINRRQDTSTLLLQLTYLPLAIVQAAAYINENVISLADYLSLLAKQEEEVIDLLSEEFEDDGRYRNIKNPVATTWLISFDQIRRRDRLAADYLSFMACIEPKDIPQSLFPVGASRKKEVDAIGTLTAYSFVNKRPVNECVNLHRLVHLATRNWLRKKDLLTQSTKRAILRLREVFPDHEHQNTVMWRKYLAHASYVLESDVVSDDDDVRIDLLWKLGMCLYQEGRFSAAEKAFLQVMETRKRMLGPEHPSTLASMSYLANTYRKKGRWDEAEELHMQVVETAKKVLGPEHPHTLASIGNLAVIYNKKGRWDEAEELEVQAMKTAKRVYGLEHANTLASMGNLALIYGNKGWWNKAEELQIQVIETRKRVLGLEHPDTLTNMSNLALIYSNKDRWDEAEELQVQVIEAQKIVFGLNHPRTLTTMHDLALTYREKGLLDKAEELQVQVIDISKTLLGSEHPYTLIYITRLASTYSYKGRWDEAEEMYKQVMETRKRLLGLKHPDTLTSMTYLASTYRNKGRWNKAEELEVQVMETQKRVLGEEHLDTLDSMHNLASTFWKKGQWNEAEELQVQVMKIQKRVLGPKHLQTLTSMNNLALTYRDKGRWDEAEELQIQVMETRKQVLGLKHPHTLISMHNLALTYRDKGRWDEAEELEMQVVKTRKRVLRPKHPYTLASMHNLAVIYRKKGRWDEAEELDAQVIEISKRVLGEEHPDTLISMTSLSLTYSNQERWREAGELGKQAMEMTKRVLGSEHPDTLASMNNLSFTWKAMGRQTEALKLMDECVQVRKRVLGSSHPHFLSSSVALNGWRSEGES
jgi:tetratricopeptide (TPR) repeat protein